MQDKVSATCQGGTMRHPREFTGRTLRMSRMFHALVVAQVASRWSLDCGLPVAWRKQARSEVCRYMPELLFAAFVSMLKRVKYLADIGTILIEALTGFPAFTSDKPR